MDKDDVYRRRAAEAQEQADRTVSDVDREAWLRVARGWLALIRKSPIPEDDRQQNGLKQRDAPVHSPQRIYPA